MKFLAPLALLTALLACTGLRAAEPARTIEITANDQMKFNLAKIDAKAGETLRYRCDRPQTVRCVGDVSGEASMVCILKAAVME